MRDATAARDHDAKPPRRHGLLDDLARYGTRYDIVPLR